MNSVLYQEKGLIDTYQGLVQQGKHPTLARFNGKLIIYTQDRDSLIEKISQFVYRVFVTLSTLFGASFKTMTQDNILQIEQSFETAILQPYAEEALNRQRLGLTEKEQELAQITAELESLKKKRTQLTNEVERLEREENQLRTEAGELSQINRNLREQEDDLGIAVANAERQEKKVKALRKEIEELKTKIHRYENEMTETYQQSSQPALVETRKAIHWLATEFNTAKRYVQDASEHCSMSGSELVELATWAQSHDTRIEKPVGLTEVESLLELLLRLEQEEKAKESILIPC